MKHPSYAKYRDSGVDWLGQVPAHWGVERLKWSVQSCVNGIWGAEADGGDDDLLCVRVADFDRTALRVDLSSPTLRSITASERISRLLERGDLLLEKSGGGALQPVGVVVQFDHEIAAVTSNFVARMRIDEAFDSRFITYLHAHLYAGRVNTRSIKQTTGIQNLDSLAYLDERVCYPPLAEQRAIAAFLDRETARIDALIATKRRFLERLSEKRAALISHALTRGLDADVELKGSGFAWLGQIPVHWSIRPVGRIVTRIEQGWSPECENRLADLEEWAVMKAGCVNTGQFQEEDHKALPANIDPDVRLEIRPGDLLMSRACGTQSLVGSVGYVKKCRPRLLLCDKLFRLVVDMAVCNAEYLTLALSSRHSRFQIEREISGAGGLANSITKEAVRSLLIALPPIEEQRAIAEFLIHEATCAEVLMGRAETAIDRLTEYRSSLIASAVTGQIDLRNAA